MSPVGGDIMRHDQIDNRRGGELPGGLPYSPRKICEDDVTSYRLTSEDRPVGPVYMRQGSASARGSGRPRTRL